MCLHREPLLSLDSLKSVRLPAGGHASGEGSGGGVWRWSLRRPVWRCLRFHINCEPKRHRARGRSNTNTRGTFKSRQKSRKVKLVFTAIFLTPTDSWLWRVQQWHGGRVRGVWNLRGRLWLCRTGKSGDVERWGKPHWRSRVKLFMSSDFRLHTSFHVFFPLQAALRAEKGQKGEPAIIEPVSCWRALINSLELDLISFEFTIHTVCACF